MHNPIQKNCFAILIPLHYNQPTGRITKNIYTIGRNNRSDLLLLQPYISHHHLTIYRRSQGRTHQFTLVRQGKNKIYLNNLPISDSKNKPLKHDDEIWLTARSMAMNCRAIGYIFKTQWQEQNLNIMYKYERQLNILQQLVTDLKKALMCSKCNAIMPAPINLQPCSHKVCQPCANTMISELIERCQFQGCNKKITAIMNDNNMIKMASSYNRYRLGENSQELSSSKHFAEQPFLLQKWVKYNKKNQNSHAKTEVMRVNKNVETIPKIQKIVQAKDQSQIGMQQLQKALSNLPEIKQQILQSGRIKKGKSTQKVDNYDRMNELQIQSSEIGLSTTKANMVPKTVDCWHCQKAFLFNSKNLQLKQCQICLHPFCNIQYPPCKDGQQYLQFFSQRIKMVNKAKIITMLTPQIKNTVQQFILQHFQQQQLQIIFNYVIMQQNGKFCYFTQSQQRMVFINRQTCLCEDCWPALAKVMILYFIKYHQSVLRSFEHKYIELALIKVENYSKEIKLSSFRP